MLKNFCLLLVILVMVTNHELIAQVDMNESTMIELQSLLTDSLNFEIMGIHSVTLKDSTKAEEFEEFVKNNYGPLSQGSLQGSRSFMLKADRSRKIGDYIFVCFFNTESIRDFYYPEEGKGMSQEGRILYNEIGGGSISSKSREYAVFKWEGFYRLIK